MPVLTVRLPWKSMVLPKVESDKVSVLVLTVLLNTAPPLWVTVTVPMSVPTAPMVPTPVVLSVRFETALLAVPVTEVTSILLAIPVPNVSVAPSVKVTAEAVISPVEMPPKVVLPLTLTAVLASPNARVAVPSA